MDPLSVFVVGLVVGLAVAWILLRRFAQARAWADLERWRADELPRERRDAIARSRSTLKGTVGEQLAPLLGGFPFAPSDARFLGNPVDYIVFDGYTALKERETDELEEIVFVEVKHGGQLTREERRIRDCVAAGRVRFEIVQLADALDAPD
ncbi:MAG: Holliday junction resolvase-like protein [Nitriliruptorales bacterium]